MTVLVTGATGCLGLNLTKRLIEDGQEVIALGRNETLGLELSKIGAHFISLDLKKGHELKSLSQHVDTIFHCAALSSPWGRYKDFYDANVLGTQNVINATPEGTRLVYVSSPSIYFNFSEQHQIQEHALLAHQPANHYIKTKIMAEHLIHKAYRENHLNVVGIRPRAIFGPFDRAIFPRVLQSEKKGVLPIIGNGMNVVDITYVDNVVHSLILAAKAKASLSGRFYNITNDEPKTLLSILQCLYAALNRPFQPRFISYPIAKTYATILERCYQLPFVNQEPRLTRYTAAVLYFGQTLNIDAAKKDLGYQSQISIANGIKHFAKWFIT